MTLSVADNSANVIIGPRGLRGNSKSIRSEREAFKLFLTEDMMSTVRTNTNHKINAFFDRLPADYDYGRRPFLSTIDRLDLDAFIGLCLYRGLYKLNTVAVKKFFSDKYGPHLFSATMSRDRFSFIRRFLAFDDEATRDER